MPRHTVQLFAAAREAARRSELSLDLPPGATAGQAMDALIAAVPALARLRPHLRLAINEEFVPASEPLRDGDVLAVIPPVSGGDGSAFRVLAAPLDASTVAALVTTPGHGAVVTFTGHVRDATGGRPVIALDYEAHDTMAERQLARLASELTERWPGVHAAVHHRVGRLTPGEAAVVVAVSAPHRAEAFAACAHLLERLKQDVPIWKKEHFADGEIWVGLGP